MKLISLYSETKLFNEIKFKNGLNIILGKYSKNGKDINGIGKSSIVNLIDFCLLADGPKNKYRNDKYAFLKSHSVSLCVRINNDLLTLTKKFSELNKVFVKKSGSSEIEYSDTEYRLILGKQILDEKTYSGVAEPDWYRTIMSFYIQEDHNFFKRDAKDIINFINFGLRKSELISFLFFLIGYDNTDIYEYDVLQVNQKLIQENNKRVTQNIETSTGKKLPQFKSEIDEYETKIVKYEEQARSYKFSEINKEIQVDLGKVQIRISNLQTEYFELENKLSDVRQSMTFGVDVDTKRIGKLYDELNREFSQFIVRTIEEMQEFRAKIIQNRRRFLIEREYDYLSKLEEILKEITELENYKNQLYEQINQPKVLDDIKVAYAYLGDVKTKYEQNRIMNGELDKIERELADNKKRISEAINEMVGKKKFLDDLLRNIKAIFMDLVMNTVESGVNDLPTHFIIEPRSNTKSPINIDIEVPRSGSLGKDRYKILAFDMTIFISTIDTGRSLPKFMIHDGVFHGIAHKTRIKYLNYMHAIFSESRDEQYVITLNEDEISLPEDYGEGLSHLDFDLNTCIIKTVKDEPHAMFFGMEF